MPIYEYQCEACDHKMEKLQKLSDEPLKVCPICNETMLNKLVSAAGFRLKGSGWYETDFKTKKPKKDENTTKKNKNNVKKSPEGTTDKSETNTKDSSNKNKEAAKTSANKSSS